MTSCTCGRSLPHRNTIEEALAILKISRPTLYRRIAEGKLTLVKDGYRSFISGADLERYLSDPQPESTPGPTSESAEAA